MQVRSGEPAPSAFPGVHGARVEVRELFYATPARLKFMRSERSEALAIAEEVRRQAMAREAVAFSLDLDGRRTLRLSAETAGPAGRLARLAAVLGRDFHDNALELDQVRDGVRLSGFAGLPTYSPRQRRPPVPVRQRPSGCATGCWVARCGAPTRTSWRATAIRWPCCTWTWTPRRLT